jgi:glycosyltransferase involved in cell wall biosynthesis
MRKVLIITYYFPPAGGAGVQRTLKFVKYLRQFDWEPVVLTAKDADYPAVDTSLLQEVPPGVAVYRAPLFEPYRLYRRFTGKPADQATDMASLSASPERKTTWSERISEFIRAGFFVPDARMTWLYPALHLGKKIVNRENISLIYSSAPPYTTHLIARKLARATSLAWVADFRDSWIGWLSTPAWRPVWAAWLERRMEQTVLTEADRVLTVSPGVREDLLSRHAHLSDQRWLQLSNGFDGEDFAAVVPRAKSERFTITYTGSMYGRRNPAALIAALQQMPAEESRQFLIRLVGRVDDAIISAIKTSGVADCFEHIAYVPHHASLSYLLASDAALLIIDDVPENRGIVTGKVFEYIGAGLTILALAPEGDAAELIRSNHFGEVVAPADSMAIRQALLRLLANRSDRRNRSALAEPFDRRNLTGQLAQIFNTTLSEKKR